jgi:putative FmdB family regulatory protein
VSVPIYEYSCAACGAQFEKYVNGSTVVACPSCENPKVMKRLSLFRAGAPSRLGASAPSGPMAGGCCGGGCGCH